MSNPLKMTAEIEGLPEKYKDYCFTGMTERADNRNFIKLSKEYLGKGLSKKCLVMIGNVGTGKTRLAVSIMKNLRPVRDRMLVSSRHEFGLTENKFIEYYRPAKSRFILADDFFQLCNESQNLRKSKIEFINDLLRADLLCLDEISFDNFSPAKQENLYLIVNRAYVENKSLIITSNFTMEQFSEADPRVSDRLREMSLIMKFEGKSFRK